jgi:hypothetical protein
VSLQNWPLGFADSPSYAAPLLPFASFPAALTVEGQIRRPEELPRVELMAVGGVWFPRGGRQTLAARFRNPVTVQSTSQQVAETIGPFPGGLVRAGMRIMMDVRVGHVGVSTSQRYAIVRIGNSGSMQNFGQGNSNLSTADLSNNNARFSTVLDVLSDTSAAHRGGLSSPFESFRAGLIRYNPTVDFSLPWYADISMISVAETAITITGATWSAGVATYTTSAPHTLAVADKTVVSGITPSGWDTTEIVSAVGSSTTFSVPMAVAPGAYTSGGQSSRISNMESQSYVLTLEA